MNAMRVIKLTVVPTDLVQPGTRSHDLYPQPVYLPRRARRCRTSRISTTRTKPDEVPQAINSPFGLKASGSPSTSHSGGNGIPAPCRPPVEVPKTNSFPDGATALMPPSAGPSTF